MLINLGLDNAALYEGCHIETVAGRRNLVTPVEQAVEIVGQNIQAMVDSAEWEAREKCLLTGPMAVWAYLVVFHAVVHRVREVWYDDGRGSAVRIAAHG